MRQISKKAYEGFNRQLNNAFKVVPNCYCNGVGIVLSMIDLYLAEKDVRLEQRTMEVKLSYMMLLPELEKAVARSARARENAARRREKKLAEQNAKKSAEQNAQKSGEGNEKKMEEQNAQKSEEKFPASPTLSQNPVLAKSTKIANPTEVAKLSTPINSTNENLSHNNHILNENHNVRGVNEFVRENNRIMREIK